MLGLRQIQVFRETALFLLAVTFTKWARLLTAKATFIKDTVTPHLLDWFSYALKVNPVQVSPRALEVL